MARKKKKKKKQKQKPTTPPIKTVPTPTKSNNKEVTPLISNKDIKSSNKEGITIELEKEDGTTISISSAKMHHQDGTFLVNTELPLAEQDKDSKVKELIDLLQVDENTALYYYDLSQGDISQALAKYFELAGKKAPNYQQQSLAETKQMQQKPHTILSPRLKNRPSQLNLSGEDGSDGMPMSISFRVKSAQGEEHDSDRGDGGSDSDSSGVGLITPRHQHRPEPLFDDGSYGGSDALPSCSSKSAVHESTSFRETNSTKANSYTAVDHLEDDIEGIQFVQEFNVPDIDGKNGFQHTSSDSDDSDDHDHDYNHDENGYSSDSSGVGLITPRHQHRPPPLFHDGEDDEGRDPLPSMKSKSDIRSTDSFHDDTIETTSSLSSTSASTSVSTSSNGSTGNATMVAIEEALANAKKDNLQLSELVQLQMEHLERSDNEKEKLILELKKKEQIIHQTKIANQRNSDLIVDQNVKRETMEQELNNQLKNERNQHENSKQKIITLENEITTLDQALNWSRENDIQQEEYRKKEQQQQQQQQQQQFFSPPTETPSRPPTATTSSVDDPRTVEMVQSLMEEKEFLCFKLNEYENVMTKQAMHSAEQMHMIRTLRKRTKLLIGQVTFERSIRLTPPTETREQAMLREQYKLQSARVVQYQQQHVLETTRRRQERVWEKSVPPIREALIYRHSSNLSCLKTTSSKSNPGTYGRNGKIKFINSKYSRQVDGYDYDRGNSWGQ